MASGLASEGQPLEPDATVADLRRANATLRKQLADQRAERDAALAEKAVLASQLADRSDTYLERQLHQAATTEVLAAMAASPADPQPVFDLIAARAREICGSYGVSVLEFDGSMIHLRAWTGVSDDPVVRQGYIALFPRLPDRERAEGRAILDRQIVHVRDYQSEHELRLSPGNTTVKSNVAVPMIRGPEVIGVVTMGSRDVGGFSDSQVELLKTFADQAVIAITSAAAHREQREALEQQTATSEILRVISQSPTDVQPVLDVVVQAAVRLCGAQDALVAMRDGSEVVFEAHEGPVGGDRRARFPLDRENAMGRAIIEGRTIHIADTSALAPSEFTSTQQGAVRLGFRAIVAAPLMREGGAIGALLLRKPEPGPFTPRQIELLATFAAQAVIAIENVRLFTELGARNEELRESLEQQTATSEVLKTISRSSVSLDTVLNNLAQTVARLCDADQTYLFRRRGELHHLVASHGLSDAALDYMRSNPFAPDRGTTSGRVALERRIVHIPDVLADPEYTYAGGQQAAGFRTMLGIPLLAQDNLLGVFVVSRTHVAPFTDKIITLAQGFADQAVIAIENARLFEELRDRQAELRVTFDNMADGVAMFDASLNLAAWNRHFQAILDIPDSFLASRPGFDTFVRLLIERGEFGTGDQDAELKRLRSQFGRQWSAERVRPDGRIIEVRNNPVPDGGAVLIYSDITERKKAEAALRVARDAAEAALDKLKAAQANLVQSEKMASLGQLTAGIAHEIKNPLNFVNNFAALSVELLDELKEIAHPAVEGLDRNRRTEFDETMDLLTGNLGKIAEHGKRADGIVKSMLSHSRGGKGDWAPSDINALVEETLNLAFHGARAQDNEFNITLERDYGRVGEPIDVVPQDVTRVFLNLFGNGFYAANKRSLAGTEVGFRPTLKVSTRDLGDAVEVKVRDNGIGIPPGARDKLFQPFFTTKPTGEGTGLGLSISYDIVTQQHGGTIEVESEPASFTEFTVRLPRRRRASPSRGER